LNSRSARLRSEPDGVDPCAARARQGGLSGETREEIGMKWIIIAGGGLVAIVVIVTVKG
jgi:hypothetical protein